MKKNDSGVLFVSRALFDNMNVNKSDKVELYYLVNKKIHGVSSFDVARLIGLPYSKMLNILCDYPPISFIHKVCAGELKYREYIHIGHIKFLISSSNITVEMKDALNAFKKSLQQYNKNFVSSVKK